MQFQGQGKPPVGVIFDSDLGNGVDAALALALLYGLEGKGEARLISNSTTWSNLKSAEFADALARFYTPSTPPGRFGGFPRPQPPVGMAGDGKSAPDTPVLDAVLEKKTVDGVLVYPRGIEKLNDTADPVALVRNAMTAQYDQNCVVALAGPATNLGKVMDLPGSLDLIARKVRLLVIAAGSYPDGPGGFRVTADIAAVKRVLAEWPTPIVATGSEVGEALRFPGSSIEADFAWTPLHPIVDAYRAYHEMPYDAPAPAMAAVLYAVHTDDGFKPSQPGTISVQQDGRTKFTPSAEGKHRYLTIDPAQKGTVLQRYVELASARPAGRPNQRFRPIPKRDAAAAPEPAKKQ